MAITIGRESPFTTDEEFAQGQPVLRRLFSVEYSCPLCGGEHDAETYVAHTADSLDELHAQARACFRQEAVTLPLLTNHMMFLHNGRGDYRRLREEADAGRPKGTLRILSVTMTAESALSCDECARRFPTIGDLWTHMGVDPESNARTADAACHSHTG